MIKNTMNIKPRVIHNTYIKSAYIHTETTIKAPHNGFVVLKTLYCNDRFSSIVQKNKDWKLLKWPEIMS